MEKKDPLSVISCQLDSFILFNWAVLDSQLHCGPGFPESVVKGLLLLELQTPLNQLGLKQGLRF